MLAYSVRDGYFRYWLKAIVDGIRGLGNAIDERKVLSKATMDTLRRIDAQRPGLAYFIRNRLMSKKGLLPK